VLRPPPLAPDVDVEAAAADADAAAFIAAFKPCADTNAAAAASATATAAVPATTGAPIATLRRCRLAYRLCARRHQLVFRVQDPGEKGELPKHLRFQVSLASVVSALPPRIFPDQADVAKVRPGFTDALAAEVDTIVKHTPNDDLAIQWDCATEVQDAYGAVRGYPKEGAIERNVAQFRTLSPRVPERVQLGYHFCFGTLGGWPRFAPSDLSATVELANATIEASGRRVDWIHIPVLPDVGEAFFAPLKNLKPRGARVYLGVVHHMDGFKDRIAMARKFLPEFGVAGYCGFGRVPPADIPGVLNEHIEAAKLAG